MRQRFATLDHEGRAKLLPELTEIVVHHRDDDVAQLASVYLAWIAIDRGDLAGAQRRLGDIADGAPGTTRDLAEVAEGAILRRSGNPERALDRLTLLVGKLIDSYARIMFDEEIARAAIDARRWYEAVAYLDLWLRDAQEDEVSSVRTEVDAALASIPADALELMLQAMRVGGGGAGYGELIKKAVTQRLSNLAVAQKDTKLARRLLEASPGTALGDVEDRLSELAESGGAARIEGRTVGLLLTQGSAKVRTRSAEVLTGVLDGLEVRAAEVGDEGQKLVTRTIEGNAEVAAGLTELASEGAAVLIAGFDSEQATVAAAWAGQMRTPVLLLSRPDEAVEIPSYAFVLGEGESAGGAPLARALSERGAQRMVLVRPEGGASASDLSSERGKVVDVASCDVAAEKAGEPRFPLAAWRAASVDSVIVLGDALCSGDARDELASAKVRMRLGVGLLGASMVGDAGHGALLVAKAGRFPLVRDDKTSPMNLWRTRHGGAPTWFGVLGRDAALLARAAQRDQPAVLLDRPDDVARRHELVAHALSVAQGDLWSTEARGFDGKRLIMRTITAGEAE